jgi:hypothetical protein
MYSVRRGGAVVRHLPRVHRIMGITPGPEDSILVREPGTSRDLGKLYFPSEGTYVRIDAELFADEDPIEIRSLHFIEACQRLIAATPERLWALPIASLYSLPRYSAETGRVRQR